MGEVSAAASSRRGQGKAPHLAVDPDRVALDADRIVVKHTRDGGYFCLGLGPSAEFLRAVDEATIDEGKAAALRKRDAPLVRSEDRTLRRLGIAVALAKGGYDPNQPRDARGRWSGEGASAAAAATTAAAALTVTTADVISSSALAPALEQFAARVLSGVAAASAGGAAAIASGAALVLGLVFIPTNRSQTSEGSVSNAPDLGYSLNQDTGRLTLTLRNEDGGTDILFSGRPSADGLFRDSDGEVVARRFDGSIVVDPDTLPGYRSKSTTDEQSRTGVGAQADAASDTDRPKLCPDPGPDTPGWQKRSEQSLAYQEQISGLPRAWRLNSTV